MPIINDAPNVASKDAWSQLEPVFWSRVSELLAGHLAAQQDGAQEAARRVGEFRGAIELRPTAEKVLLLHVAPETIAQRLAEQPEDDAADGF